MLIAANYFTAAVRIAEFGSRLFYADSGKLFCRPCNLVNEYFRQDSFTKHLKASIISIENVALLRAEYH